MAQKVEVTLIDDIDGKAATQTILFALDGKTYEIDLSDKNASKLRDALAPFVGVGRKVAGPRRAVRRLGSDKSVVDSGSIREWARENGYEVNDRGRVPANVREAYEKATAA
ncbi:Lsr2 family protein [Streptomyces sp. NPDC006872]|uniref:histone-like nucleoid-structuring protein Lsr2 n=1 Tax=Streptomyces sp. NPDC006872 TaxID=3155720 RepID=UPI0033EF73CD